MRISGLITGFTFTLLLTVPAWAADIDQVDLCAVSGPNGKIAAQGGFWDVDDFDSDGQFKGVGSFSMPLGCALGLQIDAGAATYGDDVDALGVGAHLFLRDPSSYLIGVHGTYENWDISGAGNQDVWRIGAEAELYAGMFSLEGWAGLQDTDFSGADVFAKLTAAVYLTEDLRLDAGVRFMEDFTYGAVSAEWQLPDLPVSLTAEGRVGDDDYSSVTVGAKFYFGGEGKSLIRRHREDDPNDGLFDFIGAAGGAIPAEECTLDGNCEDEVICDQLCDGEILLRE
jgi:hypothetical protein